jgi:hypothetical protein
MSAGRTAGALLAAALLACAGATPAQADDTGYRYWSFWESQDGQDAADGNDWAYATQGPGTLRAGEGDILGFRFAVSAEASDVQIPREEPDYDVICPPTEVPVDGNRVALVIDYGTAAHAPDGERPPEPATRSACAVVQDGATAADALADVAEELRYGADGLLCAIDGYPVQGCGEQVSADDDAPEADQADGGDAGDDPADDAGGDTADEPGGNPEAAAAEGDSGGDSGPGGSTLAVAAGVTVVGGLAVAAALRSRRRRG